MDPHLLFIRPTERMCVNAEVVAVPGEGGSTILEATDRNVCASTDVPNLRIHPKIPAETGNDPRHTSKVVTETAREFIDCLVPDPRTVALVRHLKLVGLHIDAQKAGCSEALISCFPFNSHAIGDLQLPTLYSRFVCSRVHADIRGTSRHHRAKAETFSA